MAIGFGLGHSVGWKRAQWSRVDGRAAMAVASDTVDLEYAAAAARITPILTCLAPYAPNLCATVTMPGDVILDGWVSDRALATQATAHIAAIPGVRRVYDHLFTNAQITDLITAALALDERTTGETIDVACAGGSLILRGVVTSAEAYQAAEEIARHAPLVGRVENALVVQQPTGKEVADAKRICDRRRRSTASSNFETLSAG
jgi:hypothetical protein